MMAPRNMSRVHLACSSALLLTWLFDPSAAGQPGVSDYTFQTMTGRPDVGGGWYDGPGAEARFQSPQGLVLDSAGYLYVADSGNHTIRCISPEGEVTTFAGLAGQAGSADGTGGAARFLTPGGVAVGRGDQLWIADTGNHTIRRAAPTAEVITIAGAAGAAGSTDGEAAAARFYSPFDLAVDTQGNVFVADTENHSIRRIDTTSLQVTTFVGLSGTLGSTDGTGGNARFAYPTGLAFDRAGNLYVADNGNHTIRKVTPEGVVTTLAGAVGVSGWVDGPGAQARFQVPYDVAVGPGGVVYVVDSYNQVLRAISPEGVVSTMAGSPGKLGGSDGSGTEARFQYPSAATVDPTGTVWIADYGNQAIRRLALDGQVTTVAGAAASPGAEDGALGNARFSFPADVTIGPDGSLFVVEVGNQTVRRISPTGTVSTFAGAAGQSGTVDGVGAEARFFNPQGVAADLDGNLYVTDSFNHTIRRISALGAVTTVAGAPGTAGFADGTGSAARFYSPIGIVVEAGGTLYVADTWNHVIRRMTSEGTVQTIAGQAGASGSQDGVGSAARFNYPAGLALDTGGNLYVVDNGNHVIRKITPDRVVTTVAGGSGQSGGEDGVGTAARFNRPYGVAVDPAGNLFIGDTGNHAVRRIDPQGVVTTLGGLAGVRGGGSGTGAEARFSSPEGLAVDAAGTLYVTDAENHAIRVGYPSLTDEPVRVAMPADPEGTWHLDVANATTTSWSWRVVRRPSGTVSRLQNAQSRTPSLRPDSPDVFVVRLEGWAPSGRAAIRLLEVVSLEATRTPWIESLQVIEGGLVLSGSGGTPGGAFTVMSAEAITGPLASWTEAGSGVFSTHGKFVVVRSGGAANAVRFYRLQTP